MGLRSLLKWRGQREPAIELIPKEVPRALSVDECQNAILKGDVIEGNGFRITTRIPHMVGDPFTSYTLGRDGKGVVAEFYIGDVQRGKAYNMVSGEGVTIHAQPVEKGWQVRGIYNYGGDVTFGDLMLKGDGQAKGPLLVEESFFVEGNRPDVIQQTIVNARTRAAAFGNLEYNLNRSLAQGYNGTVSFDTVTSDKGSECVLRCTHAATVQPYGQKGDVPQQYESMVFRLGIAPDGSRLSLIGPDPARTIEQDLVPRRYNDTGLKALNGLFASSPEKEHTAQFHQHYSRDFRIGLETANREQNKFNQARAVEANKLPQVAVDLKALLEKPRKDHRPGKWEIVPTESADEIQLSSRTGWGQDYPLKVMLQSKPRGFEVHAESDFDYEQKCWRPDNSSESRTIARYQLHRNIEPITVPFQRDRQHHSTHLGQIYGLVEAVEAQADAVSREGDRWHRAVTVAAPYSDTRGRLGPIPEPAVASKLPDGTVVIPAPVHVGRA